MERYSFKRERGAALETFRANSALWRDTGLAYVRRFNVWSGYLSRGKANLERHMNSLLGLQDYIDPTSTMRDERYTALEESITRSLALLRIVEDLRETTEKEHKDRIEVSSQAYRSELQAYMENLWDEIVASNVQTWASLYRQELFVGYRPDLNLLITPETWFLRHKNIFLEAVQRHLSGDRYLLGEESVHSPMEVGEFMFSMMLVFGENNGVGSRQREAVEAYKMGDKNRSTDTFYDGCPETLHKYIEERKPIIHILKENEKIDTEVGRVGPCSLLTAITSHPKFISSQIEFKI